MAVNITDGYETIIFAWSGKIMIGKIWKDSAIPTNDKSNGTIIKEMGVSDYYLIHNPCEIEFDISVPAQGSADLTWKLKPYFYKDLIADSGVTHVPFAFPKSLVALSNMGGTSINPNILAAYKELVG